MVEGPKVLIKSERLQCLVGQIIRKIDTSNNNSNNDLTALVTRGINTQNIKVERIFNVGKELFLILSNNTAIRLHFGMNGSERILPTTEVENNNNNSSTSVSIRNLLPPNYHKKLSFTLYFDQNIVVFFDTTIIIKYMLYVEMVEGRKQRDIMTNIKDFDMESILNLLKEDSRPILESIMDQTIIPGVGNVIKCEGLYEARIHPDTITREIHLNRLKILIQKLHIFSLSWYQCTLKRKEVSKKIYGKSKCSCGTTVTLIRSGDSDRITYYCAVCQTIDGSCAADIPKRVVNSTQGVMKWLSNSSSSSLDNNGKTVKEEWSCEQCTFLNSTSSKSCQICAFVKTSKLSSTASVNIASVPGIENTIELDAHIVDIFGRHTCKCKRNAILSRVRKDGPNKNRLFLSCANVPKKCNYFLWADSLFPRCKHNCVTILRRVLKPGENNGRYFFSCMKDRTESCAFFEFLETKELYLEKKRKREAQDIQTPASGNTAKISRYMNADVKIPL